jgi:hypothetical protein
LKESTRVAEKVQRMDTEWVVVLGNYLVEMMALKLATIVAVRKVDFVVVLWVCLRAS